MPTAALQRCAQPLCPRLVVRGRCLTHKRPSFARSSRFSRQERGYGAAWERIRKEVLERDGHRCKCGAPAYQVDHVVPKHKGGTDHPSNLSAICDFHHRRKSGSEGGKA